ncbi:MAG: hypothetical protein AAGF07_02835 [Patescibacteria group bacterium]
MPQTILSDSVIQTIYSVGSINKSDLIQLLKPYSKNPERYVKQLLTAKSCIYDSKTRLVSLNSNQAQKLRKILNIKRSAKVIDSHSLITAKTLLWFLQQNIISAFDLEKRINNTALQSDLYLLLKDGYELYFEADTGSERETELRNKIVNYDNLNPENKLIVFITQSKTNQKILQTLTRNKPNFHIFLNSEIEHSLSDFLQNFKNHNQKQQNQLEKYQGTRMSPKDIEKLIMDI